jgi:hypothetical protein
VCSSTSSTTTSGILPGAGARLVWSIIYGTDIAEYITNELVRSGQFISADWAPPPMAPFWSEFTFG